MLKKIIIGSLVIILGVIAIIFVSCFKCNTQEILESNDSYIESAATHRKNGEYEEAILNAKKAIEIDPKDPRGYGILADIYRIQKRYSESIDNFEKVMELEPTSIPNLFGMIRLLDEAFGIDEAIKYLNEWIQKNPNHSSRNEAKDLLENLKDAKAVGKTKFFE